MVQRLSERINRAKDPESGFTLIELLVVIVILGILAAVVVFSVGGIKDRGSNSAAKADTATLATAEEAFYAKSGANGGISHYGTMAELVSGGFLASPSTLHSIVLIGDSGPTQRFRITCPIAQAGCGTDGATAVGGIIRVAGSNAAGTVGGTNFLNPAVTSGGGVHPNVEYMFNGLMRWADNNTSQPDLAQSYTISPDQKTYTFTLRSGMTWHDGSAITPADVKFSFEQALLKFHGRTNASIGPALGAVGTGSGVLLTSSPGCPAAPGCPPPGPAAITTTATDVVFHFVYAYAPLLKQMNVTEAPIIPEAVYGPCAYAPYPGGAGTIDQTTCGPNNPGAAADLTNPPGQVRHIGSGPFMLKSRNTTTQALVFVKFPGYHFAGLPLADEVDQVPVANASNALVAGQVDVGAPANDRILPIVAPQVSADITPATGFTLTQPPRGSGGGNCILTESFNLWAKNELPATINAKAANAPYDHPFFGDQTIMPANPDPTNGHPAMQRGLLVRSALFMATNRQALFDANQFGKGRLATSPYYSAVPGYTPTALPGSGLTYAQATAKAAVWLTDAGWIDDGVPGSTRTANFTSATATQTVNPGDPFIVSAIAGTGSQTTYRTSITTQWAAAPIKVTLNGGAFPTGDANGNFGGTGAISHARDRDYDILTVSYCNGDDPVVGVRRQYYAGTAPGATAGTQIGLTAFTNSAGYRTTTMDALWDSAAQSSSNATHAAIQAEAAAKVPYIWLDESLGSRAWKTAKCSGFNNNNTGLFVETASCTP